MVIVHPEDKIISLYKAYSGGAPDDFEAVAASGSPRKYFRIWKNQKSIIGAYNPDRKENAAFIAFTKHFSSAGLAVPELLAVDDDKLAYLLSDLGNRQLFTEVMAREDQNTISGKLYSLLAKTIRTLPHFQVKGGHGLDYSVCYPREAFDRQSMLWDLNYFKYYILKTSGITFNEQLLEQDFDKLAEFLNNAGQDHFMYRDFQSRNVMILEQQPHFIDYQGGRKGALQYDLASFLYQVKAAYPHQTREELVQEYLDELNTMVPTDRDTFMKYFYGFVYLRIFQVLGAYGFRGLFEKRPHFAESLEPAMIMLSGLLNEHPLMIELPELTSALKKLVFESKYMPSHPHRSKLCVHISSFSYKEGLPEDPGGNGGGFIFDCRALPNPGRTEEYSRLTGRDRAVIDYLSRYREVDRFLFNVYEICDSAIENYISRDFENLSISFGCTGGQHRSVYCAEKLAEHLSKKYVIQVRIHHREQDIRESRHEQKDL
ncbi:MAG: RNase adapter RapZ [Bacteroidales bacterium]|jgi:aminoglycoside/choline kinase family phosphotransferase|nr:RNase adapter RapZ [Bacteroidales bacterium]